MITSNIPLALTYDGVLLVPQRSQINSRSLVSLKTKTSPNITINFPIISINMETVTGVELAIAMSNYGAISFYPRFKSPQIQAKEINAYLIKAQMLYQQ